MQEGGAKGEFFVWSDADRLYAVPLASVVNAIRMVHITPVPEPTAGLLGLINVRGEVTPAVSVAARFGFPSHPRFEDHLLLVRSGSRLLAVLARELIGLRSDEIVPAMEVLPESRYVTGVLRGEGALVLMPDVEFLVRDFDAATA